MKIPDERDEIGSDHIEPAVDNNIEFGRAGPVHLNIPEEIRSLVGTKLIFRIYKKKTTIQAVQVCKPFTCDTLEGTMTGKNGDYLAIGVKGEIYPIDREIFEETYELVFP